MADAQRNIFFPGSANYVSAQAQNPLTNRLSTLSKSAPATSTPGPNEERRLLEVPKPGDALPPSREVKPLDFIPPTRFSTPAPPMSDFFSGGDRSQFFSTLNRPGFFGSSPFGLNDFNLQSFPRFNAGPDFSIFNSGAANSGGGEQPKSFHVRRQYNDKDGYTPWVDAGPKRPPAAAAADPGQGVQGLQGVEPSFHQRFDLGPDGFFDFNKDKKSAQPGNAGFSGQTQAIMRIEPKSSPAQQKQQDEDLRNRMQQLNYNFNNNFNSNNNFPSTSTLAQNFKHIKWPGQN